MFMGKAQLVELGLKNILTSKYGYDDERIERWSLGRVIKELRKSGLRQDFVHLMEELQEHRNYIAHVGQRCAPAKISRRRRASHCVKVAQPRSVLSRTGDCGARFPFWRKRVTLMRLKCRAVHDESQNETFVSDSLR
jgi:hypothetical protein